LQKDDINLPEAVIAIMRRAAALVTKYMVDDVVDELYGWAALRIYELYCMVWVASFAEKDLLRFWF